MKKIKITTLLCLFLFEISCLNAQVSESFEALNYWMGENTKFEILENELHLNDTESSGSAYLVTSSEISLEAQWQVTLKLHFSPSSTNKLQVILMSDKEDVTGDFQGYYLEIGEGGSNDAIELYRKVNDRAVLLARGVEGKFGTQKDVIKIKVTRDSNYNWEVFTDIDLGFESEFSVVDSNYLQSSYFGFHCIYTSTRNDLFYFDDLKITGQVWVDSIPPELLSYTISSDTSVLLIFSEVLNNIVSVGDFMLDNEIPTNINLDGETVELFFEPFENDVEMQFEIKQVKDVYGNISPNQFVELMYHKIQQFDLVVSEVLFNPKTGNSDYIEIYNNSGVEILGEDVLLQSIGSNNEVLQTKIFPSGFVFLPNLFYVFTENKNNLIDNYQDVNEVQVIEMDIPTMNNDFGNIRLLYQDSIILDNLYYDDKYHASFIKDVEGVSLERINLSQSAIDDINWFSSSESIGFGSPTVKNSASINVMTSSFELTSNVISPDGDGYQDFTLLNYQQVDQGTLMNVNVFNAKGVLISRLYQSYYIQGDGYVKIEGVDDNNNVLPPNIYLLMIEIFDVTGRVKQYKKALTVNVRF